MTLNFGSVCERVAGCSRNSHYRPIAVIRDVRNVGNVGNVGLCNNILSSKFILDFWRTKVK